MGENSLLGVLFSFWFGAVRCCLVFVCLLGVLGFFFVILFDYLVVLLLFFVSVFVCLLLLLWVFLFVCFLILFCVGVSVVLFEMK